MHDSIPHDTRTELNKCNCENDLISQNLPQDIRDEIKTHGVRNATILTVAPTGSGAIVAQVSSGIEPIFNVSYKRRVKKNSGFVSVHFPF